MGDVDDLDTLSDADLRAKMREQGLPNVPVTSSSRKVLVKRLRASLGGTASPAVAASPKKTNKRETLASGAPSVAAPAAASTPVDKPDGVKPGPASAKARRTMSSTTNDNKAAERRRPEELVAKKPAGPAPTQPRRISTSSEKREVVLERTVKKPDAIMEEPAVTKRTNYQENTLEVNSMIVLESDEEEDEQLVRAADLVERQNKAKDIPKPRSKLTTTTTNTYEYTGKTAVSMAPLAYSSKAVDPPRRQAFESSAAPVFNMAPASSASRTQTSSSSYDYLSNPTGRYSSYVRSPAQSYVTAGAPAPALAATSGYRRSPPRQPFANELSDENEEDAGQYESTFTRNLARLRAERIGDRNSPYSRRTIASTDTMGYEPQARRSLRPEETSVSVAFRRWLNSLNEAYNLKSKMFILFVVILLIGVYRVFY